MYNSLITVFVAYCVPDTYYRDFEWGKLTTALKFRRTGCTYVVYALRYYLILASILLLLLVTVSKQTKSKTTSPLDKNFFKYNSSVSRSTFSNSREVVGRHKLAPGYYVVVPSTFKPNEDGDFILRIFSEQQVPAEWVVFTSITVVLIMSVIWRIVWR